MMWVMCNLVLVWLETLFVLVQDRCMVCMNVPQAQNSFWTHPIELIDDMRHVETCFGPFGDSVRVYAMHDLHQTYHGLRTHFERNRCNTPSVYH
jgi:hypothetical protein